MNTPSFSLILTKITVYEKKTPLKRKALISIIQAKGTMRTFFSLKYFSELILLFLALLDIW